MAGRPGGWKKPASGRPVRRRDERPSGQRDITPQAYRAPRRDEDRDTSPRPPPGRPRRGDRAPGAGPNESGEYLYGRNAVLEALNAGGRVQRVWLADTAHGAAIDELVAAAQAQGVAVGVLHRDRLAHLAGDERHHQGVLAEVAPFRYEDVDDLLAHAAELGEPPLLLALDSLQDPQNFGTLLRTALATGVHGVLIPEHRAVGVTPAVSKASAGAVERLPVARATNLARTLAQLKARGVWVYGLAVEGAQPFWEADWRAPAAVVVGAEGPGLGRLVRETCDVLLQVPMAPQAVQSLNAAVAGSLVLYEAFRQRRAARQARR